MEDILIEMQALIHYCEVTDCKATRDIVKRRLMKLSGITDDNKWSHERMIVDEIVKDFSFKFTSVQVDVIKYYLENPDTVIEKIYTKFGLKKGTSCDFISRYFALSTQERELITKS